MYRKITVKRIKDRPKWRGWWHAPCPNCLGFECLSDSWRKTFDAAYKHAVSECAWIGLN